MKSPSLLARHPWIYVVFAFVFLIVAWGTLITIAVKNSPEVIKVESSR